MIPIEAKRKYEIGVKYDPKLHDSYSTVSLTDMGYVATEARYAKGVITDIIRLRDVGVIPSSDSNGLVQKDGVYVVFWEEEGDGYKLRIEDCSLFTTTHAEMREYVNRTK